VETLSERTPVLDEELDFSLGLDPPASGVMPRFGARSIIARTMFALSMSSSTRETNDRSIFRMSTGRCFSRDSDE
jgi:hypothetical protein